jgi:hypothetical protein
MISHTYSPESFHKLYLAVYQAHKDDKSLFTEHDCKAILSKIMGSKSFTWKVVGITKSALERLSDFKFKLPKDHKLVRAHIFPQIETVRILLNKVTLFEPDEFMEFWISRDNTVICAPGENKKMIASWLPIPNEEGKLFSCEKKIAGWHHRKPEIQFLQGFYNDFKDGKIKSISAPAPSTPQTA